MIPKTRNDVKRTGLSNELMKYIYDRHAYLADMSIYDLMYFMLSDSDSPIKQALDAAARVCDASNRPRVDNTTLYANIQYLNEALAALEVSK